MERNFRTLHGGTNPIHLCASMSCFAMKLRFGFHFLDAFKPFTHFIHHALDQVCNVLAISVFHYLFFVSTFPWILAIWMEWDIGLLGGGGGGLQQHIAAVEARGATGRRIDEGFEAAAAAGPRGPGPRGQGAGTGAEIAARSKARGDLNYGGLCGWSVDPPCLWPIPRGTSK